MDAENTDDENRSPKKLDQPLLPQSVGTDVGGDYALLDMSKIKGDRVQVIVPRWSSCHFGDTAVLTFQGDGGSKVVRYAYLMPSENTAPTDKRGYVIWCEPLSVFKDGDYTLSYEIIDRADNSKSSQTLPVRVVNEVIDGGTSLNRYYHGSLFGMYGPGLVDSWVIDSPYSIGPADPVIRALDGQPAISTSLTLLRHPVNGPEANIGSIICTDGNWEIQLSPNPSVQFEIGDSVVINNGDTKAVALAFEFSI